MKKKQKYIGTFKNAYGCDYEIEVTCLGFLQAFFLLIAEVIKKGENCQPISITNENGIVKQVDDILKIHSLLN